MSSTVDKEKITSAPKGISINYCYLCYNKYHAINLVTERGNKLHFKIKTIVNSYSQHYDYFRAPQIKCCTFHYIQ